MERIICLIIGYGFGLIQTAYFIGRAKGFDIRTKGSGNAGATNVIRTLGKKAGITTLVIDVLKCLCAVTVVRLVFGESELTYLLCTYASSGVIIGHVFPFYMGFKGGKGISAYVGMMIAAMRWQYVVAGVLCFFIPFLKTHYVSLGSLCLTSGYFVTVIIMGQLGQLDVPKANLFEMYICVGAVTFIAFFMHRGNIKRLATGTERETHLIKEK